jgi:8-oxo-dGTP pyrophosphatase MutT (NUDIX family)
MLIFSAFEKLNERIGYRGAGIALFREEPKNAFSVFIGKRAFNPGKGLWSFPGGGANRGEDPLKTAAREFWEETSIKLGQLKPVFIKSIKISLPLFQWETFIFSTTAHVRFKVGKEFLKLGWCKESTFKKLPLHAGVKEVYEIYKNYRKEKFGLG